MNRLLASSIALLALGGAAGCSGPDSSGDTSGSGGGGPTVDLTGVVLQGVTDREASQLLAARPDEKLKPTPSFTSPPPVSEYLPTSPIPKFEWTWKDGSSDGMTELTYLQFGAPGNAQILRVVTSAKSFQPTKAQWKSLSVGTWVTVDIFSGVFSKETMQGDAAEGDPIQFCAMPPRTESGK